jgi:hypothetical protein
MSHHLFIGRVTRMNVRIGACGMLLLGLSLFQGGSTARGESARARPSASARACQVAYENGQQKEQVGHLVEASQLFAQCAEESCGTTLWQDCIVRGTRISTALPSVVPLVIDETGAARTDVQVKMDGQLIASQINGRAIPIDPGTHEFSFSTSAGVFASQKLTVAKGERNQALAVSYPSGAKARLAPTASP